MWARSEHTWDVVWCLGQGFWFVTHKRFVICWAPSSTVFNTTLCDCCFCVTWSKLLGLFFLGFPVFSFKGYTISNLCLHLIVGCQIKMIFCCKYFYIEFPFRTMRITILSFWCWWKGSREELISFFQGHMIT